MKPILEIKEISKKFQIQSNTKPYLSLRENLFSFLKPGSKTEEFWALKDVSFDVMPGDTIGIVGKNGAGKSTLLKVLSKITPPTKGKIICRGRIASLLEVGTGFHPELSGRENIFMNGSILGMRKAEILKNFDAIVDFSGVEKFIDTPLKHYSSGMQLRLAFAVAAFLENEILIIDEVLAVGDAEFQKKCMGKMGDVSKSGRTIILVSHSMNAIQSLSNKGLHMKAGQTDGITSVQSAVQTYFFGNELDSAGYEKFETPTTDKDAIIIEGKILNSKYEITNILETCEDMYIEINWLNITGKNTTVSFEMAKHNGVQVMWAANVNSDLTGEQNKAKGNYTTRAKIPANLLNAGEYYFRILLYNGVNHNVYDMKINILNISIKDPMDRRSIARGNFTSTFENYVLLPALEWNTTKKNTIA
ncbi:MAG: ATP-binding cassette domain-containing protein [Bacteroidia bacterium]|nr:ATP-binding cassette domain-containing protein [Bacteroidia bacterium]